MANHPNRKSAYARATALGYTIREGEYLSAPDNLLGRWYYMVPGDIGFRAAGRGCASRSEAAKAALAHRADPYA